MTNSLSMLVADLYPQLQAWRRDFHRYAESGWFEFRTATWWRKNSIGWVIACSWAARSSRQSLAWGCLRPMSWKRRNSAPAIRGVGKMVAALFRRLRRHRRNARYRPPRPNHRLPRGYGRPRSQRIAVPEHLPFREGFASCNSGMMHACGHDGHTTIGLGLAHVFKSLESQLSGTVKLIFQPAEEGTRGAKSMVEAGVVDDVDFFTAVHIGTGVPAGELVCGSDSFMATSKLDVTFRGVASHAGARPEDGRNALLAAAQAALGLYAIPRHSEGSSRINVGVLQAGTGRNVIADRAFMKVETRGATNEINAFVYQQALNAIEGAAKIHGVACDIALMGAAQSSKPTQPWVDYIRRQAQQVTELTSVVDRREQAAGSEDATYMMERVKSRGGQASYVIFGTELSAGHHNEKFDFNEQVMAVAVKTLASLALNLPTFGSEA